MWRQILIYGTLFCLANCTPTTTCDPTAANPNCPSSNPICDPAVICQQSCTPAGGCGAGSTCDVYPQIAVCEPSCQTNTDCPTGQLCFQNSIPATNTNQQAANYFVCKKICPGYPSSPTPDWCVLPNQCTQLGQTTSYFCEGPKNQN